MLSLQVPCIFGLLRYIQCTVLTMPLHAYYTTRLRTASRLMQSEPHSCRKSDAHMPRKILCCYQAEAYEAPRDSSHVH